MPSTKDTAHIRRSKGKIGNMTLDIEIEVFLANPKNKQNFINNLRKKI